MADVIIRESENAIKLTRTVSTTQDTILDYDGLLTQYKAIQEAKAAAIASYDAQLADVLKLITEAEKLGVKSRIEAIQSEIGGKA